MARTPAILIALALTQGAASAHAQGARPPVCVAAEGAPQPVIDVHRHAVGAPAGPTASRGDVAGIDSADFLAAAEKQDILCDNAARFYRLDEHGRPPPAAQAAPRFLYIYRDSLKAGVDSVYRAIENDGARICADLTCPNPYIGLESLSGPHEAWWINAFATEADTARVAHAYATSPALSDALGRIARRKASLIGKPVQGFAVYRPDLSAGPAWPVAGARFLVAVMTRSAAPAPASVWQMDSTLYVLHLVRTRREAEALAGREGRILAIRPSWSMPAPDWVAADREFWRGAPRPRPEGR